MRTCIWEYLKKYIKFYMCHKHEGLLDEREHFPVSGPHSSQYPIVPFFRYNQPSQFVVALHEVKE